MVMLYLTNTLCGIFMNSDITVLHEKLTDHIKKELL